MTYVQLSGPKDRKIAWLRPTMEQDADLSAVSAFVDVSSADGHHRGEFALVQVRGPGLSCLRPRFKLRLPTLIRGQWDLNPGSAGP